jgi:hypothetical protein
MYCGIDPRSRTKHTPSSQLLMDEIYYPGLLNRLIALAIDVVIAYIFIVLFALFFDYLFFPDEEYHYSLIVATVIIYDPLCTCLMGGTIGHRVLRMRVISDVDMQSNISFPSALLRCAVKLTTGWISFFTLPRN